MFFRILKYYEFLFEKMETYLKLDIFGGKKDTYFQLPSRLYAPFDLTLKTF